MKLLPFIWTLTLSAFVTGKRKLKRKAYQNNPVCEQLLDNWWPSRVKRINDGTDLIDFWDQECSQWDGDREKCLDPSTRGVPPPPGRPFIPCTMPGVGSDLCLANPCNHYNTGKCTLQQTRGLCNWYTKKQAQQYGLHYGCQRNPCHLGGYGKAIEMCATRSIPGLLECTWCKLGKKKVGCQRTDLTTTAECAPINPSNNIPAKQHIWQVKSERKCQCTDETYPCKIEIALGGMKKRYS